MKHIKKFKLFESSNSLTLRDLIGSIVKEHPSPIRKYKIGGRWVESSPNEWDNLFETDKGVILYMGDTRERFNEMLDEEIKVEGELVYYKYSPHYPSFCLAIDDPRATGIEMNPETGIRHSPLPVLGVGNILAMSIIPGDYMGYSLKNGIFKVYGHDGVETINITDKKRGYEDRGEIEDYDDMF